MSASKRIAFAVSIFWLSRVVTIFANLFLLPVLFRFLGKEELGLWLLLGNSQGFLGLLDLGIAPTLMRHIALAKGKSGADPDVDLTEETKQHIGDLVATGRIILQYLAVVIFFIAWISGYVLINQLDLTNISPQTVLLAWTIMCVSYSIGVWVSYLSCWLGGIGYVGWEGIITTGVSLVTILSSMVAVLAGGGLLVLSIFLVINALGERFLILGFIRWRKPDLFQFKGKWNIQYAKAMVKPSLYYWITSLGAFLILRTDSYFIAILKGTEDLPIYQAGYQIISNLYLVAVTFSSASSVFLSQAWQAGELSTIQSLTIRNAKISLSIMAAGIPFLLISGKDLMDLWLGEGNFVGYPILMVFSVMLTLEAQHSVLSQSSRATEDEKYVPCAVTAGVLNVIFTWLFIEPLGLLGVALGTMLAQLLTNNWYAVYRPLIRLKINFRDYINKVVSLWFFISVSCFSLSFIIKQGLIKLNINSNLPIVTGTGFACSLIFCIFSWRFILEKEHRRRVKSKIVNFLHWKTL